MNFEERVISQSINLTDLEDKIVKYFLKIRNILVI